MALCELNTDKNKKKYWTCSIVHEENGIHVMFECMWLGHYILTKIITKSLCLLWQDGE